MTAATMMIATENADVIPKRTYLDPIVVRPREACKMLSVGLTRLYELLHEGQLDSFRYGRSRRITIASIHAYVERQLATTGGTSWEPPP
jgi:excisionase family DNA binding protein